MLGVVFIHGLQGDEKKSWGQFPALLKNDNVFGDEIDIKFFSYNTSIIRIPFISKKSISIQDIAETLDTWLEVECGQYKSVLLVCHSLGGLVARKYLIDRVKKNKSIPAISSLVMYATPNNGADLASVGKYLSLRNRHLKQMCKDSDFIEFLNEDWHTCELEKKYRIQYLGGAIDKIVDKKSAKQFWGNNNWKLLPKKGHIDIIKPENSSDISFKILSNEIENILYSTNTNYETDEFFFLKN